MATLKGRLPVPYKLPDEPKPKIAPLLMIMKLRKRSERAQAPCTTTGEGLVTKQKVRGNGERGREGRRLQVGFKGFNRGSGAIRRFVFWGLTGQLCWSMSV